MSLWTDASENRLPIRRLASAEFHKKNHNQNHHLNVKFHKSDISIPTAFPDDISKPNFTIDNVRLAKGVGSKKYYALICFEFLII
jgi:hypothetical protein